MAQRGIFSVLHHYLEVLQEIIQFLLTGSPVKVLTAGVQQYATETYPEQVFRGVQQRGQGLYREGKQDIVITLEYKDLGANVQKKKINK